MISKQKDATVALLLCIFLGFFGAHRFYVRRYLSAFVMLITLGGLGIWILFDLIYIASGHFKDSNQQTLEFKKRESPLKLAFAVIGMLICALLLYFLLIFAFVMHLTAPMTNTVKLQLTEIKNNQFKQAYVLFADETQKKYPVDKFKKYIDSYPILKNYISISIPNRRFTNNEGYVLAVLTDEHGEKYYAEYNLIKVDGIWKIYGIYVAKAK